MKKDLIGQSVIITSTGLLALLSTSLGWLIGLLSILGLWQLASALELFFQYQYKQRYIFVWLLPILLLSLPFILHYLPVWAILLASLGLVVYFLLTARDTLIVYRRPRSFWDI